MDFGKIVLLPSWQHPSQYIFVCQSQQVYKGSSTAVLLAGEKTERNEDPMNMTVDTKKQKQILQDRYWAKQRIARLEKKIRIREKLKFKEKKAQEDTRPLLEQLEAATLGKRAKSRQKRDEISNLLFLE